MRAARGRVAADAGVEKDHVGAGEARRQVQLDVCRVLVLLGNALGDALRNAYTRGTPIT
jgi:hypothetical protein